MAMSAHISQETPTSVAEPICKRKNLETTDGRGEINCGKFLLVNITRQWKCTNYSRNIINQS